MALTWGNPATVRNIGDGAVSTHECRIFVNSAGTSGTDHTCPRADGFTAVLIGGWSRSREISVCAGGRLAEVTPSVVRAGWFVRACGWGWMVAGCL